MAAKILKPNYHEYQVLGRHLPTETDPDPKIYRMIIFARSQILAKSRFWYFLGQQRKVKRASGEILSVNEIFEHRPSTIKNFGILVRYDSRTGTHNMYKEYRDLTRVGAVTQLYQDLAGRYRARFRNIQIISVDAIKKTADVRRPNVRQFLDAKIKFPLPHRVIRPANRRLRTTFKAHRPSTHI